MKTFTAAAICFFAMLISFFIYLNYTDSLTAELAADLDKISADISASNWEQAQAGIQPFCEKWEKKRKILGFFTDQNQTEAISENLSVLSSYIKNQNYTEAQARVAALKELIHRIKENELPTPVNILKSE